LQKEVNRLREDLQLIEDEKEKLNEKLNFNETEIKRLKKYKDEQENILQVKFCLKTLNN
jgi:predicted nuclease with TOPRIM domain